MIREAAQALGIPVWDAPAAPCLSSRVMYGLPVTVERLRQVEAGEALLREIGISGDLRARHHGDHVRIEVQPEQIPWSSVAGLESSRASRPSASPMCGWIPEATAAAGC